MGRRRLALVVMAACSAKPAATTAPTPAPSAATAAPASAAPATTPTAPSPQPTAPATPASNATLAEVGLEISSLDRSVDPCVDFYQFACGGWLASNPIPNDRARWSRVGELDDKNKAAIRAILD